MWAAFGVSVGGANKRGCGDTCGLRRRLGRECGVWAAFGVSVGGANKRGCDDICLPFQENSLEEVLCVGGIVDERKGCQ